MVNFLMRMHMANAVACQSTTDIEPERFNPHESVQTCWIVHNIFTEILAQ